MTADLSVVDADGHCVIPSRLWETTSRRAGARGSPARWNEADGRRLCLVEYRMATDRGALSGSANAVKIVRRVRAAAALERPEPRRLRRARRVQGVERRRHRCRGDVSRSLFLSCLHPIPRPSHPSCKVYNDWLSPVVRRSLPIERVVVGAYAAAGPEAAAATMPAASRNGLRPGSRAERVQRPAVASRAYTRLGRLDRTGLPIAFPPRSFRHAGRFAGCRRALSGAARTTVDLAHRAHQYCCRTSCRWGVCCVLERFPELKVIVLECGGGWIAHWMTVSTISL